MALRYFFLDDKRLYKTRNKLKGNPRILKFEPEYFWTSGFPTPTPSYESIKDLIQKDSRFKKFRKERFSTSKLLIQEENIIDIRNMIFTRSNDDSNAGRMLLHLIEGNRKADTFTGIHYLPNPLPGYIHNFKLVDPPNEQGIYTASFEIQEENGKVLRKENLSTLFPGEWSFQKLYDECLYALNHRIKSDQFQSFYKSITRSGIPVEIYFDKTESTIRTLYPIRL